MNKMLLENHWWVLHTKSRFESVVDERLAGKGVESFLPKILVRSKRKDRKKMLRLPLFPGYVFVRARLLPETHLTIVKTIGAVRIIGNKDGPVPVPDISIASLKIMTGGDSAVITGPRYKEGDPVIVIAGPFAGVTGLFSIHKGKGRVIVNIDILGQFAGVEVDEDDIEPAPPGHF